MADIFSKAKRSYIMSRIKSKDTKPELLLRRLLFRKGFRYRINVKKLPGTPDIVLRKYKTVIVMHGCFWHGHEGCHYSHLPKTNAEWWSVKIQRNKTRDQRVREELKRMGWRTMVVWECQLKPNQIHDTIEEIVTLLSEAYLSDVSNPLPKRYNFVSGQENVPMAAEGVAGYGAE